MSIDKPLPYYRWFWQDYRANRTVQRMTYVERGLYRELLDECWAEGSIPSDVDSLADICGCPVDVMASAWHVLGKCFVLLDGRYYNEKLHSLRTEKDAERIKRSNSGRSGGVRKAMNQKDSVALASTCQTVASTCHIEEKRREEKRTPLTPQGGEPLAKKKLAKRAEQTLIDWLTALPTDQSPIAGDDPLLTELDAAGVPAEYVDLAWSVFVRDWGAKKAKDWPATFRNAIRRGWVRLWYFDQATGQCRLNSTGELARRSCGNE